MKAADSLHPRGTPAPTWRPCQHAPTAWVTKAAGRVRIRTAAGVVREVEEEGATWCLACTSPQRAILRWLAHGPVTAWTVAVDLGMRRPVVREAIGLLERAGRVERVGVVLGRDASGQDVPLVVWGVPA